jgi:hypothetical protein
MIVMIDPAILMPRRMITTRARQSRTSSVRERVAGNVIIPVSVGR